MGAAGLIVSAVPPSSTVADPVQTSVAERRRHTRRSVGGRVRFWLHERLGFVEGRLQDVSESGLRMTVRGVFPMRGLAAAEHHRVDVYTDQGDTFSVKAEIRHLTAGALGLETIERVPAELVTPPASL